MFLARVEGNVVATRKHPSLEGGRLIVCQPIDNTGNPQGSPQVAIAPHGAAMHQRVIISSDGAASRKTVGDEKSPAGKTDYHTMGACYEVLAALQARSRS